MINLEEEFSPRVNPADANYPFGSIKDNTSPGANDGTPLAAVWGNDWEGFAQAAMTEAGITPSGLPDTAQDSQLLDAVKAVTSGALRNELAAAGGASLVGVVQNEVGAVQTTVQRKLYESISIFDFLTDAQIASVKARDGAFDLTEQIQKAVDTGKSIFFPPGLYYKSGPVHINVAGTSLVGSVEAEIRSQSYGFGVFASHFMASGITYSCVTVDYIFNANPLSSAGLDNLTWFNCRFLNGFYAVRTGLEVANVNNWPIRGVRVIGCESIAPIGANCGHLLATKCEDVYYLLNKVKYGLNSSAYGIGASTRATIIGNIEVAVSDTVLDVEAAIQVEDSPNARVIIANNVCLHDIWVSDSSDVMITGNQCRDLRTTIGNSTSQGVGKVLFTGNKAGRIRAEAYSVSPPPVTFNVTYDSNQLDPSSYLKNGSVLPNAVFLDTAFAGNVTIARSNVISSGLGATVSLARTGANSRVYLLDNDFGTAPHAISGSNGYVLERNSINPLFPRYMSAGLGATITTPVLGAWTKLVCNSITTDVNTEYNTSTGVFTVKRTGTYRVGGMVTVVPGVTGAEMGMRLFRTSTSGEVARLTHGTSGGVAAAALTLRPLTMPMVAGEQYELQYFLTGAGTQILAGFNLTAFTIDRVS